MPHPIRADRKDIYSIPLNIIDFLTLVLFDDDLVSKTGSAHCSNTFF